MSSVDNEDAFFEIISKERMVGTSDRDLALIRAVRDPELVDAIQAELGILFSLVTAEEVWSGETEKKLQQASEWVGFMEAEIRERYALTPQMARYAVAICLETIDHITSDRESTSTLDI